MKQQSNTFFLEKTFLFLTEFRRLLLGIGAMSNVKEITPLSREEQETIWLGEILAEIPDVVPTDDELNEMERIDHSVKHGFGTPYEL